MIPEIKKILYTTDLSENARYAAGYAAGIANRFGAAITVMHSLEQLSPYRESLVVNVIGDTKWHEIMKRNEKEFHEKFRKKIEDFCKELAGEDPSCPFIIENTVIKAGNPVELILEEVRKGDYDLVVMGAHGHKGLADAVMGSTSRRVLRAVQKTRPGNTVTRRLEALMRIRTDGLPCQAVKKEPATVSILLRNCRFLLFRVCKNHSTVKEQITSHQIFCKTGKTKKKEIGHFNGRHHLLDPGIAQHHLMNHLFRGNAPLFGLGGNLV